MTLTTSRTLNDIKVLEEKILFAGFFRVESFLLQHRNYFGEWTPPYRREVAIRYDAVAALPYDPNLNQVVLLEQFRVGALNRRQSPWLIEIVAGVRDKGNAETAEELVKREVYEEAGVHAQKLLPIYEYFASPGASSEKVQLFCVKVDASKVPQFAGLSEEHEDIRVITIPVADAFAALKSNLINNALAIIALQWLEMNIDLVRNIFA